MPYEVVLDPMIGSGTTAIAALQNDRDFVGIEVSREYAQIANERIQDEAGLLLYARHAEEEGG